ncbi:MAG: LysR family transcriptional regulator [OCS116 cluster bacterium]|nr:LysR family transcriptional regulator [OCS116 cluster bacterium]
MNWDNLKYFLAVAQNSSMRAAAKRLKVSHTTISRHIDDLENQLNVKLFDRLPDGFRLTQSGSELLPIALQTDDNLLTFGRNVTGRDAALEGKLTVTFPEGMIVDLMMPYIFDFMENHPQIFVKIITSLQTLDLTRREADIAIRVTQNPPEHLIGRKLGTLHQAAYASQKYIDQHSPLEDLNTTAKWIGWGVPEERPKWKKGAVFPHLDTMGSFNNIDIQVAAARRSLGIAYVPCIQGDVHDDLVRLSDPKPSFDIWLLSHADLRATARVRAFRQYIIQKIPEIGKAISGIR